MFYWITLIITLFVSYSAGNLSFTDWKQKNVCPKIGGVPACYIVFLCFVIATFSHIFTTLVSCKVYFVFVAIPAIIAFVGSITELKGKTICPKTTSGIPMCYISFAFCLTLILTKYLSI